jgi:hypothetical protein
MKTFYLRPCLLLTSLCAMVSTHAQRSYRFEATTAIYSDLVNPKVVRWEEINPATDIYNLTELNGETFSFYKVPFPFGGIKTFAIQSNGNLRIDNDSTLIIVDGVFTYLDSIDATSSVSYLIEGTPGSKVVKGQWKNVKIQVGQTVNFVNFQIWVYQQSGIVEIHYGPSSANNQSGFNTTSGPQVGMFFSEDDFTKCYEKLWVNGSPAAYTLDSAATYSFKAMSGVPVNVVVFRFIPRFITTGTSEVTLKTERPVLLYPNPVKGIVHLEQKGDYRVSDYSGKMVKEVKNEQSIDVTDLPAGIYFLHAKEAASVKFIVE